MKEVRRPLTLSAFMEWRLHLRSVVVQRVAKQGAYCRLRLFDVAFRVHEKVLLGYLAGEAIDLKALPIALAA